MRAPFKTGSEAAAAEVQAELTGRAARLETAIEAARSTNISVARAKRLQKELQAQAAAAAASVTLRTALEEAATSGGQLSSLQVRFVVVVDWC